jgi:hypothetical protein
MDIFLEATYKSKCNADVKRFKHKSLIENNQISLLKLDMVLRVKSHQASKELNINLQSHPD